MGQIPGAGRSAAKEIRRQRSGCDWLPQGLRQATGSRLKLEISSLSSQHLPGERLLIFVIFLQCPAMFHHNFRMGDAHIAEMPRLMGDPGDSLFSCRVWKSNNSCSHIYVLPSPGSPNIPKISGNSFDLDENMPTI